MNSHKEALRNLTRDDMVEKFRKSTLTIIEVFQKKSKDYDLDFYKEIGGFGLLLRIREKERRLNNLLLQEGPPQCEPIEDNIKDLSTAYTALFSMLEFDLISLDKLKILWGQALEVDIDELIAIQDAKKSPKRKWYQFWKR